MFDIVILSTIVVVLVTSIVLLNINYNNSRKHMTADELKKDDEELNNEMRIW